MIVEHAELTVPPGREEQFIAVFPEARAVISQADGFCWAELQRIVERPSSFLLLVGWKTLEAHLEGFRGSELFRQWRATIGPFLAAEPQVEHLVALGAGIGPAGE